MGFVSDDLKLIENYLEKIDAEPDDIEALPAGQFLLKYNFPDNEKAIIKKLKDAFLDPAFEEWNSLSKLNWTEEEMGEDGDQEWFQVQIYPNWSDDGQLLDDDDKPIEVKSIKSGEKKAGNELRQAIRSRIYAKQNEDQELRSAIRQFVNSRVKKMVEGEKLTASVAKDINKAAQNLYNALTDMEQAANQLESVMQDNDFNNAPRGTLAKQMWDVMASFWFKSQAIRDKVGDMSLHDIIMVTGGGNDDDFAPDGGTGFKKPSSADVGVNSQNYRD